MIAFHVSCIPPRTSHHHKRIVRVGQFSRLADKPELVAAKAMLDSVLLPHQPHAPVEGPVRLVLEFTWPWRKSEAKRTRALGRIPHSTKPDCSNALKTLEDRLVALRFIEDDSRVVDVTVRKFFGDTPGIRVLIERVTTYGVASVIEARTA